MLQHFRPAIVLLALFTALTGAAYPLAVTGVARLAFPWQANGSLETRNGQIIGSALIGQNFASPRYFHGRPSATSAPDPADDTKTVDAPYNAANSSGSNLGPLSQKLVDRVKADTAALRENDGISVVPADAVTTSASGLDPDISPQNALAQTAMVAKARGLPDDKVRALVRRHTAPRLLGFIGEPRVNVLLLNLALDEIGSS